MIVTCLWEAKCVIKCGRILKSSKIPEVAQAIQLFCGSFWRNVYISILALSLGSALWVFSILFSQTMSVTIPVYRPDVSCYTEGPGNQGVCDTRYVVNLLILALITTPLALMDVNEQAVLQDIMAAVRVIRCILMILTPLLALYFNNLEQSFPHRDYTDSTSMPLIMGSMDGIFIVISIAVFSMFLNSSVPIAVDALQDLNQCYAVLTYGFAIAAIMYFLLGASVSFAFGSATDNPCNLNWENFRWPMSECAEGSICDITSRFVSFVIVFSPMLDVVSVYPLTTIVLANSIWEVVYGVDHEDSKTAVMDTFMANLPKELAPSTSSNNSKNYCEETPLLISSESIAAESSLASNEIFSDATKKKIIRFAVNIFPMILAIVIQNFLVVVQYAGSISVLICLVFPGFYSYCCDEYETSHQFAKRTVTPENHLSWCDKPFASNNEEEKSTFNPENSLIETKYFKIGMIILGLCFTVIIFYASVEPIPKYIPDAHEHLYSNAGI